ncbi:MAG: GntR family transcriptional regulator [Clostridia bacterium]
MKIKIMPIAREDNDKRPLYVLVYDQLFGLIMDGCFKKGEKLPGENSLAQSLGVSRGTLRQALLILQEDGVINNIQGKGNFVSMDKKNIEVGLEKLLNPPRNFNNQDYTDIEIEVAYESPNQLLQQVLQVNSSNLLMSFHKVYKINDDNTCYTFAIMSYDRVIPYNLDLTNNKELLEFIDETVYKTASFSKSMIRLTPTGDYISQKLKIAEDQVVFLIEDILYSNDGEPMVFSKSYMRPEFYDLYINRR